ncbi:hypothetical protein D3C77_727840 [compost metagenome]
MGPATVTRRLSTSTAKTLVSTILSLAMPSIRISSACTEKLAAVMSEARAMAWVRGRNFIGLHSV